MKKYIVIGAIIAAIFLSGYDTCPEQQGNGKDAIYTKMHATAYCLQGRTYTGKKVREGIAATGDPNLVGKVVFVYQRLPDDSVGEFLYLLEIEDTGCSKNVLDIWMPDLESCQELMENVYRNGCKGRVYCRFIDAEG